MERIVFDEMGMHICFRVNDDKTVELTDFSAVSGSQELRPIPPFIFGYRDVHGLISVQIDGESSNGMNAYKHNAGSENGKLLYQSHSVSPCSDGKLLEMILETPKGLRVRYFMRFYEGIRMVRTWGTLENTGTEPIGVQYVTSFYYEGVCKNGQKLCFDKAEFLVPRSNWNNEAQWHTIDATDAGLSRMGVAGHGLYGTSNNRFHYGNAGSWSTCEYMPIGMIRDQETGEMLFFEIDHSGSWEIEIGSSMDTTMYLALMGPNDEHQWWKCLKPGESFTTVPAAIGVLIGDESDAVREMTRYRRRICRPVPESERTALIFNDYMNCLLGDLTEENERKCIDEAARLGCEYYCMDAGWYDAGFWWDSIGEWKESPERFPNGLKALYEYARSKGLKMGMWLEIENMGIACKLAQTLPDDWFFCRHGKRVINNKRYVLDFRNPDVRNYCRSVVDRLIRDYGCTYFKVDYNVTTGIGSDLHSDSFGDAMLEHYRALYDWYRDIFRTYPDLIIETCGSGGQRMDYGMLQLFSLQSISDQTDYLYHSFIAANVASALTPEQAGTWVYPYEDDREHVIYNVVNGLLLRPYCSGKPWMLSPENWALYREGMEVYKSIRSRTCRMTPFFPLGFTTFKSPVLAYGLRDEKGAYLSVFAPYTDHAAIPLDHVPELTDVRVLYPVQAACDYAIRDGILHVQLPQAGCARTFELKRKEGTK